MCEEIDRLYKCLDRDDDKKRKKSSSGSSSASSSSSSKKKKQSKKPKGKKEKEKKEKGKKEKKEKNEPKKRRIRAGSQRFQRSGFRCCVWSLTARWRRPSRRRRIEPLWQRQRSRPRRPACARTCSHGVLVTQAVKDASNKLKWANGLLPKLSALPWPHSWLGVRLIPTMGDKHAESVKIDVEEKKQALEAIVNGYVS